MSLRRFKNLFKNHLNITDKQFPSLPPNISYVDLNFMTARGFLANKIGRYLGIDEGDSIYFYSLSRVSFSSFHFESKVDEILYYSEKMLTWQNDGKSIPANIHHLEIKNDLKNAMLKAYEIHKQDLFMQHQDEKQTQQIINTEWDIYRDVIYAASQGKLLLIPEEEIANYKIGVTICEGTIKQRSDIPECRNLAKKCLEEKGVPPTKMMSWLLVLSEAITNTIKHAEEGKMTLVSSENEIRFIIEDKGPGFPLNELPKATLLAGYSTKKSMGQGFTLMMKVAKQILLCSSSQGATIILTFDQEDDKEEFQRATS
mgnify:CR=1 FL=1